VALPEHAFRFSEFRAPDNQTGGESSGSISGSQSPLENQSSNPSLPTEQIQIDEVQQTLQAVGLVAQSLGRKRIDLPTDEIATEYLNGAIVTEMAQRYNVSTKTIYRRLHEAGFPRHAPVTENIRPVEKQFWWRRDLSPDGQKLYEKLIEEGGDKDILVEIAIEEEWNLEEAIDELRKFSILDESNLEIVKLIKKI
jgi:hypothetical protein